MLKGQLYINGKDAYLTWGIFLDETALSALMTPAPNKEFISNKYRSKDGKSVIKHNPRLDERDNAAVQYDRQGLRYVLDELC